MNKEISLLQSIIASDIEKYKKCEKSPKMILWFIEQVKAQMPDADANVISSYINNHLWQGKPSGWNGIKAQRIK